MEVFENVSKLNEKYEMNNYNGKAIDNLNYLVKYGSIPILFSAPHAVKQLRNNQIKNQDGMTGGIVEYLSDELDTFAITRVCNLEDDPNFYNTGPSLEYKNKIIELTENNHIGLIIDIHGCKNDHGFDIELGTNNGLNLGDDQDLIAVFYESLAKVGITMIDTLFKAKSDCTVSNYIHKACGIPCLQIEISSDIRFNPERLEQFIKALKLAIFDSLELKHTRK